VYGRPSTFQGQRGSIPNEEDLPVTVDWTAQKTKVKAASRTRNIARTIGTSSALGIGAQTSKPLFVII
jgi:hypothetical protein